MPACVYNVLKQHDVNAHNSEQRALKQKVSPLFLKIASCVDVVRAAYSQLINCWLSCKQLANFKITKFPILMFCDTHNAKRSEQFHTSILCFKNNGACYQHISRKKNV